jgi:hypothetical protein
LLIAVDEMLKGFSPARLFGSDGGLLLGTASPGWWTRSQSISRRQPDAQWLLRLCCFSGSATSAWLAMRSNK